MDKKLVVLFLSFCIGGLLLDPLFENYHNTPPSFPWSEPFNPNHVFEINDFSVYPFPPSLSFKNGVRPPEKEPVYSSPFPSRQFYPAWWEIRLLLTSNGKYTCKEAKKSYTGDYSFMLLWTGCMEQDMDDYLIYYENCALMEWKAHEKSPDLLHFLTGSDFSGKPRFDFHYIFRRENDLHFDFRVESFYVPQNNSDHKFYLTLPASLENSRESSLFNYNDFVYQGSNNICIKEEKIYLDTIEKSYTWKWKCQKQLREEKKSVFFTNSHRVKVEVSLIPRY